MKRFLFWAILLLSPFGVLALGLFAISDGSGRFQGLYEPDPLLGWRPKPEYRFTAPGVSGDGIEVTTNRHGFRAWGDPASARPRILFIGDSFTGDPLVSDPDAYFNVAGRLLDAEVYAFGAGGYGTYQELMIAERFGREISPDVFVLQFCPNDFGNNSIEFEAPSIVRNQKNLRPYFVDGQTVYRLSPDHWYRRWYARSSRFRSLDLKLQRFQFGWHDGYSADGSISRQARLDAEAVTGAVMARFRNAFPDHTRLVSFTCDSRDPEVTEKWAAVSRASGFTPLAGISEAVERAEDQGQAVRAPDGSHWNRTGHEIAGKALAGHLGPWLNPPPDL